MSRFILHRLLVCTEDVPSKSVFRQRIEREACVNLMKDRISEQGGFLPQPLLAASFSRMHAGGDINLDQFIAPARAEDVRFNLLSDPFKTACQADSKS